MGKNTEGIVLNKMISYFEGDCKRINHALKVLGFAKAIAAGENLTDREHEILVVTAILHDIGIKVSEEKYNSSSAKYQEAEGPVVAGELLQDTELDESFKERVYFLIGHHHTYQAIDGTDFQILVEADFLVNAFEGGREKLEINDKLENIFKTETGKRILTSMYLK